MADPINHSWNFSTSIIFRSTDKREIICQFSAKEIIQVLNDAFLLVDKLMLSDRDFILPDLEAKYKPAMSFQCRENKGFNRNGQADLPYIKFQMENIPEGFPPQQFYAKRWYLLAKEMSNFAVGEAGKFLGGCLEKYKTFFGMKSAKVNFTYSSQEGDKSFEIYFRVFQSGRASKLEISNYQRTIGEVTKLIESMKKDLNDRFHSNLMNVDVDSDELNVQERKQLGSKMKEVYDLCLNLTNLTGGFLYVLLCDRVVSVERLGCYIDDVGFLVDIQLTITTLIYKSTQPLHDVKLFLKRLTENVQQISDSPYVQNMVKAYCNSRLQKNVDFIEDFKNFRSSKFNEDSHTSANRVFCTIAKSIPPGLPSSWNLEERLKAYQAYVKEYKQILGFSASGNSTKQKRNYNKLYRMIMKGELPLLKSFWSCHAAELIRQFSTQANFTDRDRFKGLSYPEFARLVSSCDVSDKDLVMKMRSMLSFSDTNIDVPFLPTLVVTLFFAEVSRFPRSQVSTLMMLDLIQSGSLNYTWETCLYNKQCDDAWNKNTNNDMIKSENMFGEFLPYKKVQGRFPMSNLDSAKVTVRQQFRNRIEHQKEAAIIIDWLLLVLQDKLPGVTIEISSERLGNENEHVQYSSLTDRVKDCLKNLIKLRTISVTNYSDVSEFALDIANLHIIFRKYFALRDIAPNV